MNEWMVSRMSGPEVFSASSKKRKKMGREGTYVNIIKNIYNKLQKTLFSMVRNWKHSLSGIRQECPLSPLSFNIILEGLAMAIKEKDIKGVQIGKEEVKLSLFADDIVLYIENPKDTIRKLLELINEFSKVTG